jgi:SAM-dependent methyltransferase
MGTDAQQHGDPEFDRVIENYDAELAQGLAVSGESKEFFAEGRVAWLGGCLEGLGSRAGDVLDFGCGDGSAAPFLSKLPGVRSVLGVDVSPKSLEVARELRGGPNVRFEVTSQYRPSGALDLAFCNGVFHHIPVAERGAAVRWVFEALRPGGYFSFWENNPWNPGTRYVMSRVPFDRDAITLSVLEAKRLLRSAGFEVVRSDSLFWFPRVLKALRPLERWLAPLPFGAQYQVLVRKP